MNNWGLGVKMNKLGIALIISIFFLAITGANAFSITAPDSVIVPSEGTSFFVKVYNGTEATQSLKVNFLSIAKYKISAPTSIPRGATADIKITVFNNSLENYNAIDSKIEVYLGKNLEEKNIILKMNPTAESSSITTGAFTAFSGLFSLGSFFSETGTYSIVEWIVFWILVIIAAVLLIGFIARILRRT